MDIGSVTLTRLPGSMTMLRPDKRSASVETYSDVAYFSWSPSIVGKVITLSWNAMETTQFTALDAVFQADAPVVFDPTDYDGSTSYNVELIAFNGEYLAGVPEIRINCQLELLILSVVA